MPPSGAERRADPALQHAFRAEGGDRQPLNLGFFVSGERRRNHGRRARLVHVLRRVRVEAIRVIDDDLADTRRNRLVVAQHRALELAKPGHADLDHHLLIEAEGELERGVDLGCGQSFRDADARAQVRRFDEYGPPACERQRLGHDLRARSPKARRSHDEVRHDRQARLAEESLHHVLVHADRGAEHARPHERDVCECEQALHGAVFSHGTVEHGEHDVDVDLATARSVRDREHAMRGVAFHDRRRGLELHGCACFVQANEARVPRLTEQRRLVLREPAAALVDPDQHRLETVPIERLHHEARRQDGDLVLCGATPEQHRNAQLLVRRHVDRMGDSFRKRRGGSSS